MIEHEPKPVAWMHPKAKWADADYDKVRVHCLNDGPLPEPLYPASDITALQEEVAAAEARANAAEQRLKEAVRLIERLAPLEQSKSWLTLPQYAAARTFIKEAGE